MQIYFSVWETHDQAYQCPWFTACQMYLQGSRFRTSGKLKLQIEVQTV